MVVLPLESLPLGFRFHPTDEELINHYLKGKINGRKSSVEVIPEIDVCKCEPWDLPDKALIRSVDPEWFFFAPRDRKYPTGHRSNRATEAGYWKATGKDRTIKSRAALIGMKKTLVFYQGRAPKGVRTGWVMHEYRTVDSETDRPQLVDQGTYVLCRLFKKYLEKTLNSIDDEVDEDGFSRGQTKSSPGETRHAAEEEQDTAVNQNVIILPQMQDDPCPAFEVNCGNLPPIDTNIPPVIGGSGIRSNQKDELLDDMIKEIYWPPNSQPLAPIDAPLIEPKDFLGVDDVDCLSDKKNIHGVDLFENVIKEIYWPPNSQPLAPIDAPLIEPKDFLGVDDIDCLSDKKNIHGVDLFENVIKEIYWPPNSQPLAPIDAPLIEPKDFLGVDDVDCLSDKKNIHGVDLFENANEEDDRIKEFLETMLHDPSEESFSMEESNQMRSLANNFPGNHIKQNPDADAISLAGRSLGKNNETMNFVGDGSTPFQMNSEIKESDQYFSTVDSWDSMLENSQIRQSRWITDGNPGCSGTSNMQDGSDLFCSTGINIRSPLRHSTSMAFKEGTAPRRIRLKQSNHLHCGDRKVEKNTIDNENIGDCHEEGKCPAVKVSGPAALPRHRKENDAGKSLMNNGSAENSQGGKRGSAFVPFAVGGLSLVLLVILLGMVKCM